MKYIILSLAVFLSACSGVKEESLKDAIIAQTFCGALGLELDKFRTELETNSWVYKDGYNVIATCAAGVMIVIPIKPKKEGPSV